MFYEFIYELGCTKVPDECKLCNGRECVSSVLICNLESSRCVALQVFPMTHVAALRASATAADSKTPCVCACQSNQPKLCWRSAQAQAHGIAVIAK